MPTYSYRCQQCNHEFDAVQRITEDALRDCPSCKNATLKRQITSGNFILKGAGWYSDLYSGGSNKPAEPAAGTATAAAATTTTGSTDSTANTATTSTTDSSSNTTSTPAAPSTTTSSS